MTVEIREERDTVYFAYCEDCDWGGETFLDKDDAEYERKWHAEHCEESEDYDPRDERQRYQDALDEAMKGGV